MDILMQTLRKEGFFALYKGLQTRIFIFDNMLIPRYIRHG